MMESPPLRKKCYRGFPRGKLGHQRLNDLVRGHAGNRGRTAPDRTQEIWENLIRDRRVPES
jgi:hypothetical protein